MMKGTCGGCPSFVQSRPPQLAMQFISFIQMRLKKHVPSVYWVSAILFAFALGMSVRLVDIPHLKKV